MRSLVAMLLLSACASAPVNSSAAPYVVVESDSGSFHIKARTSPDQLTLIKAWN